MLEIQWRSGFGYGDFVSGLGYAHGASKKYQTDVQLTFHWNQDANHKEHESETETIIERMYYVYSVMNKLENVSICHRANSNIDYRFINNLDEFDPLHGLWYSNLTNESSNTVVLWRSKHNTFFPGKSKDPAFKDWDRIINALIDKGFEVREVTYRTPIEEVIELIRRCDFGIGYDGSVHQLFKFMWKPLIVICERHSLNRLLIPQAALVKSANELFERGIDSLVSESLAQCNNVYNQHQHWLSQNNSAKNHQLYNKMNGK